MNSLTRLWRNLAPALPESPRMFRSYGAPTSNYDSYGRAYQTNEIVYAAVKLLATSAAEPHIIGKRLRRDKAQIRAQSKLWRSLGVSNRAGAKTVDAMLVMNKYVEEVTNHPLVTLLNNPNPFTSRGQLWASVVMDLQLAGNAYLLKARGQFGNVAELWRLRPDRVRIIPSKTNYIEAFEYTVGQETIKFPAGDIIHFKDPNPLDDYYGQPPLMAAMDWVSIEHYQSSFLRTFYEKGGTGPGSVLTVKSKMLPEAKEEIRDRFRRTFGGSNGFHEMLILDNTDSSYTQMGLDRGLRDALPKEIEAMSSSRITMVFGIPGSIIGLLIGYESSSYANKRADWQVLWDIKMTPLMSDLDDALNLYLVPEFAGVDEVCFDLSDIRALQEDEDALQERARKNFQVGLWSWEETRAATGVTPNPTEGTFFIPTNISATPLERVGEEPAPPPAPVVVAPEEEAVAAFSEAFPQVRRGRPPLLLDSGARSIYEQGEALRAQHPGMTLDQVAGRVGVSVSTYKRYRATFSEPVLSRTF